MGTVWEELTVKNADDVSDVRRGLKRESEIRQIPVRFKVDSGAASTIITEDVAKALGLSVLGTRPAKLAGGSTAEFSLGSGVEIWWRDRNFFTSVLIAPNTANNLMGVIAMEALDITPDVVRHKLVGAHGDEWICEVE